MSPELSGDSSRYHYDLPDYQSHPDPYDRTWVLLKWVGEGKRVLELGCSTGYMSKHMAQKQNCFVTGIEVDGMAAKQAAQFCREVIIRDLNDPDRFTNLVQKNFDVVLMGDVLEHLADPQSVLVEIRELLDRNAKIVVCLPNVLHWITRLKMILGHFDYDSAGTLDHTHLRFYTVATSRRLIESAGYRITKFRAAFGGRLCGHARPVWQWLANSFPGLFAFQLLYEAEPLQEGKGASTSQLRNPTVLGVEEKL